MFWKILCHSSLIVKKRQNACWYVKPIKNHTCWLPCSWCVYFKQQCASCGKTCACGSSTCLRMRGRVLYLNLHRAGSYWTFSTLNFYPHSKTFFTRGKKALQKPVLRGEKGGGAEQQHPFGESNRLSHTNRFVLIVFPRKFQTDQSELEFLFMFWL